MSIDPKEAEGGSAMARCQAIYNEHRPSSRCQFDVGHEGIHQAYHGGVEWYDGECDMIRVAVEDLP